MNKKIIYAVTVLYIVISISVYLAMMSMATVEDAVQVFGFSSLFFWNIALACLVMLIK